MSLVPSPWRFAATLLLASAPLLLSLGCGGKSKSGSTTSEENVTLSGKVTYVRIPLVKSAAGVPLGPETDTTKFQTLPVRGALLRIYQSTEETQPDGTKTTVWRLLSGPTLTTNSEGNYSFQVPKSKPLFIELTSHFSIAGQILRIVADPSGINSALPQADRLTYGLRKGADGSAPAGNPVPGVALTANSTVNFEVGLTDKWWLAPDPPAGNAVPKIQPTAAVQESVGTGSRVLAIGESAYTFSNTYGAVTPTYPLDLHYRVGIAESRGTYVEYDQSVHPLAFDAQGYRHYFGSVRGGASNDDAFDEGVLFPVFARNNLLAQAAKVDLLPVQGPLTNLSPALALVEGYADAMSASLLKSPYLADMLPASATYRDIRNVSGLTLAQKTPYSAPNVAALSWEILLKANSLPSPGTVTDWAKLEPKVTQRFFSLLAPSDATSKVITDTVSLYGQLARLKEGKAASETVDLAGIFTDAALTPLLQPYNIAWPRPTTGEYANFLLDWGANPNGAMALQTLSMANAVQVGGVYPNVSAGEVAYGKFTLSKDTAYNLKVQTTPAALVGGLIEVTIDGQAYTFAGTADPAIRVVLKGNSSTAILHQPRVRLLSPTTLQPNIQLQVRLDVAP